MLIFHLLRWVAIAIILSDVVSSAPLSHLRSCYMLFGYLDDLGYTYAHNLGRLAAHKSLLQAYPTVNIESIVRIGAYFGNQTAIAQELVQLGCHVIHGTAPGFTDTMLSFAARFPNITFSVQNAFGLTSGPSNLVIFASRTYKPWYVAGRVAAKTAQNKICFLVAWNNVAEAVSAVIAFSQAVADEGTTLGRVEMLPMQSWYDPPRELVATTALHKQLGCDVTAHYTDAFTTAQYAASLNPSDRLYAIQMHGRAYETYGDTVLTCVWSDWSSIYRTIDEAVLLGQQSTMQTYVFSAQVPQVCDVSPQAKGSTVLFASAIDVSAVAVFDAYTDSQIRNLSSAPASLIREHPAVLDHTTCAVGSVLSISISSSTSLLTSSCVPCAANFYTTDHITCNACPTGLVAEAGSASCHAVAASVDVGAVVGGVVGAACAIIIVFSAVLIHHRRRMAALLRDNSNAPLKAPCGILFTDVEGSTNLWNQDPDGMAEALTQHNEIMRAAIAKHGGYEVKTVGDCFMIATRDLNSAIAIAAEIQTNISKATWPPTLPAGIRVRIGVDYGTTVDVLYDETTKGYDYFGPTVNRAARCEQSTSGGRTVGAAAVLRQASLPTGVTLSDEFPLEFHGFDEPVNCVNVVIAGIIAGKVTLMRAEDPSSGSARSDAKPYIAESTNQDVQQHPLVQRGVMTASKYVALRALVSEVLKQLTFKMRATEKREFLKELGAKYGLRSLPPGSEVEVVLNKVLQAGHPQTIVTLAVAMQTEANESRFQSPHTRGL